MKFPVVIKTSINVLLVLAFVSTFSVSQVIGQERERVVDKSTKNKKKDTNRPRPTTTVVNSKNQRESELTNKIVVNRKNQSKSLVKKTSSSRAINSAKRTTTSSLAYSATTRALILQSIKAKIGLRYRYGSQGPRTYDCSGFVWKVFQDSGIEFTRTSARNFWRTFTPVYGDDRYEFGTLVFLNRLGHVGIVADKNGFYHASTSKGVTYSKFAGYWSKRIVGFRRVPFSRDTFDVEQQD